MSPAVPQISAWCRGYELTLEAAGKQVRLLRENGELEEAEEGLGQIQMWEQDQVQTMLQELTQQMVHLVQAWNEEKGLIEEEFAAGQQDLELLEAQICSEKARIEGELSAVGGHMLPQQGMISEMRQGIMILQKQDTVIIKEAGDISQGIHKQIHLSLEIQTKNGSTLLNHRRSLMMCQEDITKITWSNLSLTSKVEAMDKALKTLPTKDDLSVHAKAINEAVAKIQ